MTTTLSNRSVKIQIGAAISALLGIIVFTSQFTTSMNKLDSKAGEGVKALAKYGELNDKVILLEKASEVIAIKIEYLTDEHAK